jgi:hypothetical protein
VLGEDLGKAIGRLDQVLHAGMALNQPKALLSLEQRLGRELDKGCGVGRPGRSGTWD